MLKSNEEIYNLIFIIIKEFFMPVFTLDLNPNEQIESKFSIRFFCITPNRIEIHYPENNDFGMIETSARNAEIFYNIIENLYLINPNLNCRYILYANQYKCFSFSNINYNLENPAEQYRGLWIYFQVNSIKIQFSMTFRDLFLNFYSNNQGLMNDLMHTSEAQIHSIFIEGNNNPDMRHINKISRYSNGIYHDWVNLDLFNKEPLPLLFEFFKELNILNNQI